MKNKILVKHEFSPLTHINEATVSQDFFSFLKYVRINLWSSFYYQVTEILSVLQKTDLFLEVGKGTGVIGGVLKELGVIYESMDINPNLKPVHIGSVDKMPFKNDAYDIIGCFEVLEHLPFDKFVIALSELFRVANRTVIISLPNAKRMFPVYLYFPRLLHKKVLIPFPFHNPNKCKIEINHNWEINYKKYNFSNVKETMEKTASQFDFSLKREYRIWENPYHHFFIFQKNKDNDFNK
jgi:predicted SAM-dependent methyltransferase